jgi:hypothetical protein
MHRSRRPARQLYNPTGTGGLYSKLGLARSPPAGQQAQRPLEAQERQALGGGGGQAARGQAVCGRAQGDPRGYINFNRAYVDRKFAYVDFHCTRKLDALQVLRASWLRVPGTRTLTGSCWVAPLSGLLLACWPCLLHHQHAHQHHQHALPPPACRWPSWRWTSGSTRRTSCGPRCSACWPSGGRPRRRTCASSG